MSLNASIAPWRKDWCSLSTQSSSPISSSSLQVASCFSSVDNQPVVRGKLGRMKMAITAIAIVMAPSIMNSQRLEEKSEHSCSCFELSTDSLPSTEP